VSPDATRHGRSGEAEAIALGGEHLEQLPAPGEHGIERLGGRVGQAPNLGQATREFLDPRHPKEVETVGLQFSYQPS
jgi:hypothetical protein